MKHLPHRLRFVEMAFLGGGLGGGSTDIDMRNWRDEKGDIKNSYKFQQNQFNQFLKKNPLLSNAGKGALGFYDQLGGMLDKFPGFSDQLSGFSDYLGGLKNDLSGYQNQLAGDRNQLYALRSTIPGQFDKYQQTLSTLQGQLPGQFDKYQRQLSDLYSSLPGKFDSLQNQLGGYSKDVGRVYSGLRDVGTLTDPLMSTYQGLQPILARQGGLTDEQARDVNLDTRSAFASRGNLYGSQAIGAELLNRDKYRRERFSEALGQAGQLTGQISGLEGADASLRSALLGQRAGIAGQQAGLTGMQTQLMSGITGQQAGLTGQETSLMSALTGQRAGLTDAQAKLLAGITGQMSGVTGQQAGISGQQAGMTGMQSALTGQQAGLLNQQQGLQTGGLNQLLGVQSGQTSNFNALTNPMLSYLSNLFGGNLQGSIAQAGINQQGNIAGANKQAQMIGSILDSVSNVAGAAIGMSDERLKEKIRGTGIKSESGAEFKTFEYKTRPGVKFVGFTAQDVEAKDPSHVITDPTTGIKSVSFKYFPVELKST